MRIEAYSQIAQMYKTQSTTKAKNPYGTIAAAYDQVEISRIGRDFQVAKQAVTNAADVREELVAQMKERVAKGKYDVSADSFAEKLLEKLNAVM